MAVGCCLSLAGLADVVLTGSSSRAYLFFFSLKALKTFVYSSFVQCFVIKREGVQKGGLLLKRAAERVEQQLVLVDPCFSGEEK